MTHDPANPWAEQPDDFSDLGNFDHGFTPQQAFRPNIETLSPGDYDFEVTDAALDHVSADRVLRVGLRSSTGRTVEHTYWLNDAKKVNALGADLVTLGFDADRWGAAHGRSLAVELPKAVLRLKGIKFRATKTNEVGSGTNAGRTFHKLYINCRLDGRPMPALHRPVGAGTDMTPPAPTSAPRPNGMQPAPAPAVGTGVPPSSDIPF